MKRYLLMLVLVFFFTPSSYSANTNPDLPQAPEGFKWSYFKEIKGYFLAPDNWFVNAEKKDNTLAYFISKENYKKEGIFKTGVSINVFPKLKKINSLIFIQEFIKELKRQNQILAESGLIEKGPFKQYIVKYKIISRDPAENIILQGIYISNTITNTMYFILFESPEAVWEENWLIGEKILTQFAIDDEI